MRPTIVLNRRAGSAHRDRALGRALARRRDLELVAPSDLDELQRVAAELRRARLPRLGVVGGDGTVHALLSALHRADAETPMPTLALLGGGTLNTIARSVGVRRRPLEDAISVFASLGSRSTIATSARSTMRIADSLGSLFGVGVVETFLRAYYATGNPSPATAAQLLGKAALESIVGGPTFRSFTGREVRRVVTAEGETLVDRPTLTIAAGTIGDLGLGFRPFHRVDGALGTMHLVNFHGDAASLARALPRIRLQRALPGSIATERATTGFTITTDSAPIRYMVDGDLYEHAGTSLVVSLGPTIRYATLVESARDARTLGELSPRST